MNADEHPRASDPRPRRRVGAGAVGLVALVAFFHRDLLGGSVVPVYSDLGFLVLPFKHLLGEALRAGSLPLWNPWILLGTPFLAALQTSVVYPLNPLLLLPFPFGFDAFLVAHHAVAIVGAFVAGRRFGASTAASAVAAIAFTLGGVSASSISLINVLQSMAWAPWIVVVGGDALRAPSRRRLVGLAALLAVQFLGGSPEVFAMTLVVLATLGLTLPVPAVRSLAAIAAASSLALALVAFQILPTFEYAGQSPRAAGLSLAEVAAFSTRPVSALQLLLPHSTAIRTEPSGSLGWMLEIRPSLFFSLYLGVVPLAAVVASLLGGWRRAPWVVLLVGAVVLALGEHTPLLGWLHAAFPGVVGRFRFPEKLLFLAHAAAVVLVLLGTERVVRGDRRARRAMGAAALGMLVFGIGVVLLDGLAPDRLLDAVGVATGVDAPREAFRGLAADATLKATRLVVLASVVAGACFASMRVALPLGPVLVLVTALDLVSIHRDLGLATEWQRIESGAIDVGAAELRAEHARLFRATVLEGPSGTLALDREYRPFEALGDWRAQVVEGWQRHGVNTGMVRGLRQVGGFDGLGKRSDDVLRDAVRQGTIAEAVDLLATFGVARLSTDRPLEAERLEPFSSAPGPPFVYRVRDPRPLVFLVDELRVSTAIGDLLAPGFDPEREALVASLPVGWTNGRGGSAGTVHREVVEAERLVFRTETARRAFLVVNESHDPGWEATVDGEPRPLLRTNAVVRGLAVPAGSHRVELRFRPASLRRGAMVSVLALGVAVALVTVRRRTRSGSTAARPRPT